MYELWLIAAGLLAGLLLAEEVGFRIGRRTKPDAGASASAGKHLGIVLGALLGLLALLLGFSFAGAATRFLERQDLITTEANAIGTAYLRADMLDDPASSELRSALRRYTEHRIQVSESLADGLPSTTAAEVEQFQTQIWKAASEGVRAKPTAMLAVLNPVNEVIDLHATRLAAGRKHLPALVLGLLISSSVLAMGVIGFAGGLAGHRQFALNAPLAVLIAVALWTTIDLDHPRAGLMQLSDAPLKALKFAANPSSP